jgi:hypothetical protein
MFFFSPHISETNQNIWSVFSFIYIRIESSCADQFFFFNFFFYTKAEFAGAS